jgi:hypothetical protein
MSSADRRDPDPGGGPDLVLGPATRLLWRSPQSVQLELGSRAVVVEGLPTLLIRQFASPEPPGPPGPPAEPGVPLDPAARRVLTALTEAGYLWPRPHSVDDPRLTVSDPRLGGELTALAARHGEAAAEVLSARRHTSVQVQGRSRVAAHLAAVLAAAGVGRVHCTAAGVTKLQYAGPGGVLIADEGFALAAAAEAAILRAAPGADTTPLPIDEPADLIVLAVDEPVSDDRIAALHAAGTAYLTVALDVDHGVVGPLVVPGLTGCLRCADLHRRDRDPAWSALAVQLTVGRRYGPSSDVVVATTIAGVAAQQALTFLDGGEPGCIDGTIELRPPDWRLRRRSWPPHAECGCIGVDEDRI